MMQLGWILLLSLITAACGTSPTSVSTEGGRSFSEVSPKDAFTVVSQPYTQFIDVRTPEEFAAGHAERARNIPLDILADNIDLIRADEPVYLICRSGSRSAKAAQQLTGAGINKVFTVAGGTDAWQAAGLPMAKPEK